MTVNQEAPLRVVQFCNTLDVADGGPARHALDVHLGLNTRHDVAAHLLHFQGGSEASLLDEEPYASSDSALAVTHISGNPTAIREYIKDADVVIIEGFYLRWVPLVARECTRAKVPYVVVPHGVFTRYQRKFSKAKKWVFDVAFGAAVVRGAAGFVVASASENEQLREVYSTAKVTTVGIGTAIAPHRASGGVHTPLRLLSLSRIAPKKRIDIAIEAVKLIAQQGHAVELTIAGSGEASLVEDLNRLAVAEEVDHLVKFAGEVRGDAKTHLLLETDIFVSPSEDENFGMSTAEALAHGVPVVVTRHVSSASVVTADCGIVIDSADSRALAEAVISLAAHDFDAARSSALDIAKSNYAWTVVTQRWVDLVSALHQQRNGQ